MLFSCKITNSILTYLEEQGEDLSLLYESAPLPEEFLRDPSYWMRAEEMEAFFALSLRVCTLALDDQFLEKVAQRIPDLKSWGVLDSVLKMMPHPEEILQQPERFLANFISPKPVIESLRRAENGVEFHISVSADQFPLVTGFLRAAVEVLPNYVGQTQAQCRWSGTKVEITWGNAPTIFAGAEDKFGHQISPELLRSVITQLEKHQKQLEEKNRQLSQTNEQLLQAQRDLESHQRRESGERVIAEPRLKHVDFEFDFEEGGALLSQNLSRMQDYLVRAQQLITILVGQDRMSPPVKEAMRRVDWEYVREQFPQIVRESRQVIDELKNANKGVTHVRNSSHPS